MKNVINSSYKIQNTLLANHPQFIGLSEHWFSVEIDIISKLL
jgi:hypothetical protein